jgi:microcystin-dependent protein
MPNHSHVFFGDAEPGNTAKVKNNFLAEGYTIYKAPPPAPAATFAGGTTPAGSSLPHDNHQPYTTLRWVIAVEGIFPAQN